MNDFRKLHPAIQLRIFMVFVGTLTFSTVGSSMTIYYNQHLGAGITGFLLMVSSLVTFFVGLWAGHLSDRLGRRPIMLYATLLTSLGGLIAVYANSPWYFNPWLTYLGFLILGFGWGFYNTASMAMMVDLTDSDNRKIVYSLQYWVINVAILLGSAISGWFFKHYLFELLIAITLEEVLSFVLVFFFIDESFNPKTAEHKSESNIIKAYRFVARDHTFLYYCFGSIFTMMIFGQVDYYLPVHLSDHFITSHLFGFEIYGQRMLTIFLIINTALIVAFMGTVNRLTKHWSRSWGVGLGISIQGLGFILAILFRDFTGLVVASVIATLGEMIFVPFSQALRADLMDGDAVGTYSGAFSVVNPMASILGSLSVSASVFLGNTGMAGLLFVVVLLGLFPILTAVRRHERPVK
ncbi:MDR family MFS transporter [Lactococcus termiticola]|uniref:Major facilitator superfamily transporter n=1 Tax=Lactococcus termiticola TaxID=2169526 RepID=A0A2R5HFH3_9LACT|nr:MFS transporter [Lactococcus termiticola]GBG96809.1 major facilitator superfamily transporter [Lactococcus termiticola]